MNETVSSPNSTDTAAESSPSATIPEEEISSPGASQAPESLDNSENPADTEIRALLEAQLAEESPDDAQLGATTPTEPPSESPHGAPPSWSDAEKAYWDELPQAARDTITRRERELQNSLRTDREIQKVLEPLEKALEGTGQHVNEYLSGLLQADQFIAEDPLSAALAIIERHRLADAVADRLSAQPAPAPSAAPDDRIAQLEQTIARDRLVSAAEKEWSAFKSEHSDAEDLSTFIAGELQANPSFTYAQAYEATKQKLSALATPGPAAREAAEISRATAATHKANVLNLPRGDSAADVPQDGGGSLRETIEAAVRNHS